MYNKLKTLKKENEKLEASYTFKPEVEEALTNIVVYIRCSKITEYQQELIRRDITNMLIDGDKRGLSVQEIIGDDLKEFCENVLQEVPKMTTKEYVLYNISLISNSLGILIFIYGLSMITGKSFPLVPISVGLLIEFVILTILAIALVNNICKTAFNDYDSKTFTIIIFLIIISILISLIIFNKPLFYVHIGVVIGIGVVLLLISKIIGRIL